MTYPERLRALRLDSDLTQAELAAKIGISQKQYGRYETGVNELPLRYLTALCRALGVSSDYLLGLPRGLRWPR